MELLSPKTLQVARKRSDNERASRIAEMSATETELTRKVNDVKATREKIFGEISSELETFKTECNTHKRELLSEIESLEQRRSASLQPVDGILADANAKLIIAESRNQKLIERENAVSVREAKAIQTEKEAKILMEDGKIVFTVAEQRVHAAEQAENAANFTRLTLSEQKVEQDSLIAQEWARIASQKAVLDSLERSFDSRNKVIADEWIKISNARGELKSAYSALEDATARMNK